MCQRFVVHVLLRYSVRCVHNLGVRDLMADILENERNLGVTYFSSE